ncbi:MAG: restriction endonuclease subunit S, partial [Leptospiraceae bacterium]|nr:restriction endonuclease subunit S [Leptospiraceae bacterium]MDW7976389.1 restriction endonuclease subunit S [Leptospiraceae bacterium]
PRPKGDPKFYGGNIPRLMVQDVTRDYKYVIPRLDYLTLEGAKKSRFLPKGTVIIQVSGNPGTPCILGIDACIHDGFAALIDLDRTKINDEFIFYYFDYSKSLYKQLAFGAIFQNLQTYSISKFLIPIPPLPEQKVIAHILQTIDDKIQKEEAKKKALENLFKSMLHNLMSGKIRVKSSME